MENELNCIYLSLRKASRRCDSFYKKLTSQVQLTPTQLHILYSINLFPGNNSAYLSNALDMSLSTFVREVNILIKEGLVINYPENPNLKIKYLFKLTEEGSKLIESLWPEWKRYNQYLSEMVNVEPTVLCNLLDRLGPNAEYGKKNER